MSLSDKQIAVLEKRRDEIIQMIGKKYNKCSICMPWDGGEVVWIVKPEDLIDVMESVLANLDIEVDWDELPAVIELLHLECPGCRAPWDSSTKVAYLS